LEVGGSVERGKDTLPLISTREWESGDGISLTVRASRNIFVTIAYCDGTERMSVYPESGVLRVPQDQDLRIPSTGVFRVDANLGVESLYVIGSAAALEDGDPGLAAQLRQTNAAQIGAPCAAALDLTTEESRTANAATRTDLGSGVPSAPNSESQAAPSTESHALNAVPPAKVNAPGPRPTRTSGDLPTEWLPRGLNPEESAPTTSFASRSDRFGMAILAFRRNHSR